MRRPILILAAAALLGIGGWLVLRPRASHDSRLAGVWQDRRLEQMRKKAHDRGPMNGQGSWLVLEGNGEGRQIDYSPVTSRSETDFRWRTEEKSGSMEFFRSYESVGEAAGVKGRSGETRYSWTLTDGGKTLTLKGDFGAPAIYDRIEALPDRVKEPSGKP